MDGTGPVGTGGDTVVITDSQVVDPLTVSDHGDGTYTATVADTHPNAHTIHASINGQDIAPDVLITFAVGALSYITVTPDPAGINADTGHQAFAVEGFDQYDNSRGDATGDTSFTATGGVTCTLSDCATRTVGSYTVTGHDSSKADDATLNVVHGAPTKLHITTGPCSSYTADENAITVVVQVEDNWGNLIQDDNSTLVSVALHDGTAGAALGGTLSRTVVGGVATFSQSECPACRLELHASGDEHANVHSRDEHSLQRHAGCPASLRVELGHADGKHDRDPDGRRVDQPFTLCDGIRPVQQRQDQPPSDPAFSHSFANSPMARPSSPPSRGAMALGPSRRSRFSLISPAASTSR